MPGRFELKPTLVKIWQAPDHFHLMDPLPPLHRRGLILAALLVVIGFLLPTTDDTPSAPVSREAQIQLPSSAPQQPVNPEQTPPAVVSEPQQVAPGAEASLQQQQPEQQPARPAPVAQNAPSVSSSNGIEQQWRSWRVEEGKTLAQLFRDHNLPPTDAYAMAKVEGEGKPLSGLQSGQMVKIRQNANGVVTGLAIDSSGQQVLFTRQPDGSFLRAR